MRKIRVLVVDDSVVIRRMLSEILSEDPEIEVVGAAATGAIALAKIPQVNPDLVTLDVEMPGMSGLDTLVEIRKIYPRLPVVMFSSLTERAASTTLEALGRGATDYVTKPSGTGSREASIDHVRTQLLPKIRTLGAVASSAPQAGVVTPRSVTPLPRSAGDRQPRVEILALASSTGGPNAVASVFAEIPKSFPVPVVIVQHMPPLFTKMFADRLSASCPLQFHEAQGGELLEPGHVYIAPGDYHMRVVRDGRTVRLVLDQGPPENSCRPAADVLFRSVVTAFGAGTLAVVLTGMGQDGLRGCEHVRAQGGQIVVQDQASSVVWSMPGVVAKAGLADAVVPLSEIAGVIQRRVSQSQAISSRRDNQHVG